MAALPSHAPLPGRGGQFREGRQITSRPSPRASAPAFRHQRGLRDPGLAEPGQPRLRFAAGGTARHPTRHDHPGGRPRPEQDRGFCKAGQEDLRGLVPHQTPSQHEDRVAALPGMPMPMLQHTADANNPGQPQTTQTHEKRQQERGQPSGSKFLPEAGPRRCFVDVDAGPVQAPSRPPGYNAKDPASRVPLITYGCHYARAFTLRVRRLL